MNSIIQFTLLSSLLALQPVLGESSFDYVIVGAGPCGLVLANQLSANPAISVAVIEPGDDVRNNPNVSNIANWVSDLGSAVDWQYPSAPQTAAANRTMVYNSGKAIGGTTAINGMTYVRGDAPELDAWEELGNKGWNWESLWPYYKGVEGFVVPTAAQANAGATWNPANHNENGQLTVSFPFELINGTLHNILADTWQNLGIPLNPDPNGGDVRGFSIWPMTVDRDADRREDAGRAFYWPVSSRPNLKLIKGTARKLLWAETGKRGSSDCAETASGVEYLDANNETQTISANKEVILSAGALRTAPILELSGVGNPKLLTQLGIETKIDLPGVGENFQDQPIALIGFATSYEDAAWGYTPYATFVNAEDLFGSDKATIAAATKGKLAQWAADIASASNGAVQAAAMEKLFTIQHSLIFDKNVTIGELPNQWETGFMGTTWWSLLPFSRGSVHLRSTATEDVDAPVINPRFFTVDHDIDVFVSIGKLAQKMWSTEPVRDYVGVNAYPGDDVLPNPASDEQWLSFVLNSASPNHHPIGSASMMARELGGVVSPEFKVYGTKNVRVVDASILPLQISGHLTSTLYAIAQRASDVILKSA